MPVHAQAPVLREDAPRLLVPRTDAALRLDGALSEPAWRGAARTGAFLEPGTREAARPHSDARLLWDGRRLLLALYAADEDIRTAHPAWLADAFQVRVLGDRAAAFDVSASGALTAARISPSGAVDTTWQSGAEVAVERDGTPDVPGDRDEEWVVELALPLDALGLRAEPGATVDVRIARCDRMLETRERRCGETEAKIVLQP